MKKILLCCLLMVMGISCSTTTEPDHNGGQSSGDIVGWGKFVVPGALKDLVAVMGGYNHSLGLKSDGAIVAWGRNTYSECNVPAPNADFVAVAGGEGNSLGLKK
jgi:hypothetical protein